MLISRLFDGVSDVIMGLMVERTNSRWGKSRPWLLWMSVPYAVSAILLFTVPQTTGTLQFLYLLVAYNFCTTVCYTAINLPYGSLSAMMTRASGKGYAQHHPNVDVAFWSYSRRCLHIAAGEVLWRRSGGVDQNHVYLGFSGAAVAAVLLL